LTCFDQPKKSKTEQKPKKSYENAHHNLKKPTDNKIVANNKKNLDTKSKETNRKPAENAAAWSS
jgi:hypothetical protein